MIKYQEIRKFLNDVDSHPEWARIDLSQPFIEEVRELINRATPMKVKNQELWQEYEDSYPIMTGNCLVCGNEVGQDLNCCHCCGQAISWGELDANS